ncbi:GspH/FimT family pseudopilin [Geoalkalibacter sp.]|jgi:type II secretion system protein H|uniref:GspH/FimT family pseudopilin n=1 Tax=Geoalkalibacter sp. TaxID=3041440 RepID=UPI00272E3586|nr:GspH/FimT family pseudopilin [Geoalkalibacter sp.]
MLRSRRGFALIEALVVLGLIGILVSIATPYYQVFMQNASYRSAARDIAGTLRQARAEAVTKNREHRVQIDFAANSFQMSRGNQARGTAAAETNWQYFGLQTLSPLVDLRGLDGDGNCSNNTDSLDLRFFPDGTASNVAGICIQNRAGERRFLVQLTSRTTGHVEVRR